jgi:aspartate/methionine/tyrosine aminotransferase
MDELDANRRVYAQNRALLLDELPKAGFENFAPADGAFYLYCDVNSLTNDSHAFARTILEETGVAATPGIDFDAERGQHFIRFSYAGTTEDMAEAVRRLKRWSDQRRQA